MQRQVGTRVEGYYRLTPWEVGFDSKHFSRGHWAGGWDGL